MSTIDVTVNRINEASTIVVVCMSVVNFIIGAFGLILNLLVFTRPSLRREPCSLYFFSSTCFNLFVVFVIVPVRIVSEGFNIDLANYNLGICKIEFFTFYTVRTISCWLILLACIDRYLHSSISIRVRQLSSLKAARMTIGFISIMFIILYSHMIGYYEITYISDQFGNITPACYGQKGIYRTFIAFWYMTLYSLFPSFLMLLFGVLTMNNLRQHRRVVPTAPQTNRITRRTDAQLWRMLVVQILVIIISTLPFSIYRLYASFTVNLPKDTLRRAQENLAFEVASTMTYFAHTSSFYLYTLTGTIFRKEFIGIIKRCWYPNQRILVPAHTETLQMSVLKRRQPMTVSTIPHNNTLTRNMNIEY